MSTVSPYKPEMPPWEWEERYEDTWYVPDTNAAVEIEYGSYVSFNVYCPDTELCRLSLDIEEMERVLAFMKEAQKKIKGYEEWLGQGRAYGWTP